MKIYIGADHGGYQLKGKLIVWLKEMHYDVVDCGNTKFDPLDDFPDFAFAVADKVAADSESRGIVICRSAGGVTIAANKVKGIRCVTGVNLIEISHNRGDDDANVLALAGDYTSEGEAKELIKTFLSTAWQGIERFVRRLDKIKARET
jgi:ribose 5-phosphate isomerase B